MPSMVPVVMIGIMLAEPCLGARLKLDEKRLAQHDENPFESMMGSMGSGFPGMGNGFPGMGNGFPGMGGMGLPGFPNMGGQGAAKSDNFIVTMGDLRAGAAPQWPSVPECFVADESMKVPMLPVMQDKLYYDGKGKRVRTEVTQFGRSAYMIALDAFNCKLSVDASGEWKIEPLNGQFPNFQLIPGATYLGSQVVDGVDCYRYQFKLVFDIEIWVSVDAPHWPVYMSFTAPMIGTIHHHLKNHQVNDCSFKESLFDAPQCIS